MDNQSLMNYILGTFGDGVVEFTGSEIVLRLPMLKNPEFREGLSKADTLAAMIAAPRVVPLSKSADKTHAFMSVSDVTASTSEEELALLRNSLECARKALVAYAKYCNSPRGYKPNHDKGAAYSAAEQLIGAALNNSEYTLQSMEDSMARFISRTEDSED